jgi:hypothetical protein
MSGLRGLGYDTLAALLVGMLVGLVAFLMVNQMAQVRQSREIYLADTSSLDMLYKSRNVQEYLEAGEEWLVEEYAQEGGPRDCGTLSFGGRPVSIWKSPDCELAYSPGLVANESGRIAGREAGNYETYWGVDAKGHPGGFSMGTNQELQFGRYQSEVNFSSPLGGALDEALQAMQEVYDSRSGDSTCIDDDRVYWADLDGLNFTYVVLDGC